MCCLLRVVVSLGLCLLSRQSLEAADWPQWRGPARDGHSSETGLFDAWGEKGPELVWQARGLGKGFSGVSVVGGKIFTSGNQKDGQAVVAISAADGKKLCRPRSPTACLATIARVPVRRRRSMGSVCTSSLPTAASPVSTRPTEKFSGKKIL